MLNRSKSSHSSFIRFTTITFMIGLVLALAITASARAGFADSFASFFGFAAETTAVSEGAPDPAAPIFTAGTCDTAGPIEVESSGGTAAGVPTAYAALSGVAGTGAFATINAGVVHTGVITIDVCGNADQGTATATLNAGNVAPASWTSITMSPAGGVARTISGGTTAGSPLIDLSGADNVTIDGLNTGGNALTITNTTASTTVGTSTIRFIGGAANNTITNSTILGSFSNATLINNGGNIFFSTDVVSGNGNDNNTISNNNIGPAGATLPIKVIYCNGSVDTTAVQNSGITINNNNIFDYFHASGNSSGLYANQGCTAWAVTNNRFYQTGTRTFSAGVIHKAIDLGESNSMAGATVTGNIIGYSSSTQTGTYTLTGSFGKFHAIQFFGITGSTVSNISNNTIAAVSLSGVQSNGASSSSPFIGILIRLGNAIVNGNTIGSQTATGSLNFSTNTTNQTDVYGIYALGNDDWTANSNNIGGISVTNAGASGTFLIYGMRSNTIDGTTFTGTSNNVGGTVANSISLNAAGTGSQVVGMYTTTAAAAWTSNTVRNLTTNIGTGTTFGASVIGLLSNTSANHTLSQNTIHTLTNSNATGASVVTGIQFTGSTANIVERNRIYGLTVATNSTTAEVNGIRSGGGTTVYRNNMIALGAGMAAAIGGAALNTTTVGINGISEASGTNSYFHNSVYIGGSPSAGFGNSYAFNGTQTTNTRSFRDNIFFNARSNGGTSTGKNYAIKINGTTANPTGLTINNNVYFANGTGAVFGFYNSLDVANIGAWRTAVGQDVNSFESNPQFNDPTNATPDLHLHPTNLTVAEGNGADVGVTLDYDGQTRSGLTPVDIGADAGNFTGGASPTPTHTNTPTPANTATDTPTPANTSTFTPTPSNTATDTPTPSATETFTPTETATATNTATGTATATNTATSTPTFTPTPGCGSNNTLSGSQEVPPNASPGTGNVAASLNAAQTLLTINFNWTGLTANASAAHIHGPAAPGFNGPVVFGFSGFPLATSGSHAQSFAISPAQVSQFLAGQYYINIHNTPFPNGEIRAQLTPTCVSPTPTATNTPTDTPTATGTPTDTPTETPTPAETPSINGSISYGNAIGNPVPPRFVRNVSVASTSGTPAVGPVITGTPGTYTLTGFGSGGYTIKPTKPGGSNGAITSNDAARVAEGVSSAVPFVSLNQKFASDASGNGTVSSNDAALIARFAAGLTGTGNVGQWKFFIANLPGPPTAPLPTPPYNDSRTYASVASNLTGEDYVALLIGEASGNYNPATHPRPAGKVNSGQWTVNSEDGRAAERPITITVEPVVTSANKEIVIPVNVEGVTGREIISYEFDLRYDPSVMEPLKNPVDVAGTVSRGLMVVTNPYEPGLLRVVVYGSMPIDGDGVLLNLRFTAVGAEDSVSPLTFERIMFNDGEPIVMVSDGKIELY